MISGTVNQKVSGENRITVAIGQTQANATYQVQLTPGSSPAKQRPFHIENKTTTTFDIVWDLNITGDLKMDWLITP